MHRIANEVGRREVLRWAGIRLGGIVSAPTTGRVLSGCEWQGGEDWLPEAFSVEQNRMVRTIGEIIIPETDTPGLAGRVPISLSI